MGKQRGLVCGRGHRKALPALPSVFSPEPATGPAVAGPRRDFGNAIIPFRRDPGVRNIGRVAVDTGAVVIAPVIFSLPDLGLPKGQLLAGRCSGGPFHE